jgi:hypothetical protein
MPVVARTTFEDPSATSEGAWTRLLVREVLLARGAAQ